MRYSIKELITDKISGEWGDDSIYGDGYKVIRTTNFTNLGKINFENVVERKIDEKKVNQKYLKKGDVIIEKSGGSPTQPVGRVVFFDLNTNEKYLCNNFTAILRPNSKLVCSKYLFYQLHLLHTRGRTLKYQNKTTGIINLKLDNYLEEKIEVPSIPNQIRIANLLTKAENLISQRKKSIHLLDEYLKSTFLEMFGDPVRNEKGWKSKKLNELTKVGTGGTPSRKKEDVYYNGNVFWAKTTEVKGTYIFNTEEKITDIALKESNCKVYPVNTILLAMYGQGKTRGNVGLLMIESSTNQACAAIPPTDNINHIFLYELLKNSYEFLRSLARGGNQENLNLSIVGNIEIIIPSIDLQTRFAKIVENTETLKAQYNHSLNELENLYGSLSQKAFKDELSFEDEKLMIAAEPKASYIITHTFIPDKKQGFAKQVLGGKIVSLFKDDKNFSHIKFQKLQYLAEHFANEDLLWNYYRQSAGPYDNKFMHNVANKLKQNKWFEEKNFRFYPLAKAKDIDCYYKKYFGNKNELLNKLFSLLKNSSEKFCEAVATIYAVWNNHIILKQDFNVERIKQDFFE